MDRRYHKRHTKIIDPDKLKFPILLAGLGTIGSWTALALDKIGCSDMQGIDPDTVEAPNVGCQVYSPKDIGNWKTLALGSKIVSPTTFHQYKVEEMNMDKLASFSLIINAVDSMDTRKYIFENLQPKQTLIDGRMSGNAIEIYTAIGNDPSSTEAYKKTLFDSSRALPIPCGMKAVAYNGFVCAGLIADLVAKYANGETLPKELLVDLKNFTLFK